jgi:hypothetical protein
MQPLDMRDVGFDAGAPAADPNMPIDVVVAIEDLSPVVERMIPIVGRSLQEITKEMENAEKENLFEQSRDERRIKMVERRPSNWKCYLVHYKGPQGPLNLFIDGKTVEDEQGLHTIARAHPRTYLYGSGSLNSDVAPLQIETDKSKIENHWRSKYKVVEWRTWDEILKLFAER